MKSFTIEEIARRVKGDVVGDSKITVKGISGLEEAKKGDITFLANDRYRNLLKTTKASCVITSREIRSAPVALIRTDNPSFAFAQAAEIFNPHKACHPKGISAYARIAKTARIGAHVAIGDFAVIGEGAVIGDDTVLYAGCFVGNDAKLGDRCIIYPHVVLRENTTIGNNVIIHSNSVIGADGFGFATIKGVHHKIPQIGTVEIGDDVEIGAGVTIDRARFGKTSIGRGTKIDNLVQIAHNVEIGEHCIIVAQAGISGSTVVGAHAILAGQAGVAGHLKIGAHAIVAAQAGVTKDVAEGMCVSGYPAKEHAKAKRLNACLQKLPELLKEFQILKHQIEEMKRYADRNAKNVKEVNKS